MISWLKKIFGTPEEPAIPEDHMVCPECKSLYDTPSVRPRLIVEGEAAYWVCPLCALSLGNYSNNSDT